MRVQRSTLAAAAACAVAIAVYALWPKGDDSPEARIRQRVMEMADAAEQRKVGFIVDQLSERFRTKTGEGKEEVRGIILAQVLRGDFVRVFPLDLEVTLTGPRSADFSGKFVFARSAEKDVKQAAQRGEVTGYRIDGKLELEAGGEWRFVFADHRQLEAAELF